LVEEGIVLLSEQVVPLMAAAVSAHGDGVLAATRDAETDPAAALGRRMLQEIFGARAAGERLRAPLAVLIADPQDARSAPRWKDRCTMRCITIPGCRPR
jgi:hypothetical protein